MNWDALYRELEKLPPSASEWDEVERFADRLGRLIEDRKGKLAAARTRLGESLSKLRTECSEQLAYFGFTDVAAWSADCCPAPQIAAMGELLHQFAEQLSSYAVTLGKKPSTLAESQRQRAELSALESLIQSMHCDLQGAFGKPISDQRQPTAAEEAVAEPPQQIAVDEPEASAETAVTPAVQGEQLIETPEASVSEVPPSEEATRAEAPVEIPEPPAPGPQPKVAEVRSATETASMVGARDVLPPGAEATEVASPLAPEAPEATPSIAAPPAPGELPLYCFEPSESAQGIAAHVLQAAPEDRNRLLPSLLWRLIGDDRLGLAFHLARYLELADYQGGPYVPPWLIRACALGCQVCHVGGDIARLLQEDFSSFQEDIFLVDRDDWNQALRFLLASACFRPALLAPITGASSVLHSLRTCDGLGELYEYCRRVAGFGDYGQPLDPTTLKNVKTQAAWQKEMDQLYAEVEDWLARAAAMTMTYCAATQVWREWLKPNQLIHALLTPVRQKDTSRKDFVRQEADRLADSTVVVREVQRTDRTLRERRREGIVAKALGQLQARVREAVSFARRWVALLDSDPRNERGFVQRHVDGLRRDLSRRHEAVLGELKAFEKRVDCPVLIIGAQRCRAAVEDIRSLFDPDIPFPADEPDLRHVLYAELLRIGGIPLDDNWEPSSGLSENVVSSVLRFLAEGGHDWSVAFDRYAELRDHEGTERIVELLLATTEQTQTGERLQKRREQRLLQCRDALRLDVGVTRQAIEDAVAFGLLREEERNALADTVDVVEMNIETALTFDDWDQQLRKVRYEIQSRREAGIEEVRRRMCETQIGPEHPAYQRITAALENHDVLTANEYIDMVVRGEKIPEPSKVRDRLNEFLTDYQTLEAYLERVTDKRVIDDVRAGRSVGPVSLQRVPGAQAKQAAEMLEAWFTAKRQQSIDRHTAGKILAGLGLTVLGVEMNRSGRRTWLEVRTHAIRDRELCPVPAYGSLANGRYKILCVWDRPTEEDLVSTVGTGSYGAPVVVFHFGRLTQQRRRDLARLCRERQRGFIVVDDMLLIYLCGERGSRLPVLFDCALPFTFQTPYTTTAGLVPPEMFYGRQRARKAIIDPMGTCFIYGGRQLGKTALLRQVEHEYHDPKRGRVALWIDLKTEGIGSGRTIDDVWSLLAGRLKDMEVLPSQVPAHVNPKRLLEHVEEWLNADDQRRILLLLDEADRFLESDGEQVKPQPFHRVEMFKGLMDRTNRRFKVVFAGLHDVQRTSRQVNQPLAPGHYGDPLCIGPLINNGEWREARALIERPLAAIGYRFESPDLVTRILSQTNYYPSLIQLYCSHLLKHLQGPHAVPFDSRRSPPYVITSRHVEEAYHSQELRRAIRDRFNLTLNLDRRYRVIALTVALYSQPGDGDEATKGFTVSWIRDQALTFWPRGFRTTTSEDAFHVLLDEMVGLGVLRKVTETRYTLRSPNVAALIGTIETIQAELESCENWPEPAEYNPAAFRTAFHDAGGRMDPTERSPLTAEQESDLRSRQNGVAVVVGCKAAGLERLEAFLKTACGIEFFLAPKKATDETAFSCLLDNLHKREKDGVTLVFVDSCHPWTPHWVEKACQKVSRLKSPGAFVQVVFVANPSQAWAMASEWSADVQKLEDRGVRRIGLARWLEPAIRQWLDDCSFGNEAQERWSQILDITGGWPVLLYDFLHNTGPDRDRWQDALNATGNALGASEQTGNWYKCFGIDACKRHDILRTWADYHDPVTIQDLAELADVPASKVQTVVRWAELLSLAAPAGNGTWHLDPVVAKLVQAAGS